ncbi:LexA family transcriptional regulator [Novosphingobium sp.]|uniref:XRE family transcriptional regulator n=1 Tax=Novosphingobium sp. TaxID=1874826 RepID=UPI00262E299C|nr:LexA family transcriptional regulator [Novosphingobium sp.]
MILPERLQRVMALRGLTQTELARRVGISVSMVNKLTRGAARESAHIYAIAKALNCSPEYLSGDSDDLPDQPAAEHRQAFGSFPSLVEEDEDDEIVEVQEIDLAFGMGGGGYLEVPVKKKRRKFTRGWLRLFTKAPHTRIFIAQGIGDSMAPTIMNADMVIIDTAENEVRVGDQIWAAAYGQTGVIKRLRPMPDGGVKIMSDNPLVEAETAYDGELHVLGKVVAVIRRMAG